MRLGVLTSGGDCPGLNAVIRAVVRKVERDLDGTIIGFREVNISANGSIGAVAGGAVGGVLGAEYANSALVAVGGTTVGGMLGNALEHAARDTTGWEYIIRKENSEMLSVTQREATPLALAQRVLVDDLDADLRLLVLGLRGLVDDRLREGLRVEVQGRLVHEVAGVRCGAGDGLRAVQAGLRGGGGDVGQGGGPGGVLRGHGDQVPAVPPQPELDGQERQRHDQRGQ